MQLSEPFTCLVSPALTFCMLPSHASFFACSQTGMLHEAGFALAVQGHSLGSRGKLYIVIPGSHRGQTGHIPGPLGSVRLGCLGASNCFWAGDQQLPGSWFPMSLNFVPQFH